jgi:hypothetical protein
MCQFQGSYSEQMSAVNLAPIQTTFQAISPYNATEFLPEFTPHPRYQTSFERATSGYEPQHENFWDINSRVLDLEIPAPSNNPAGFQDLLGFPIPPELNQEIVHFNSVDNEPPNLW